MLIIQFLQERDNFELTINCTKLTDLKCKQMQSLKEKKIRSGKTKLPFGK